jgi:LacI family transcriptional regulator
MQRSRVKMADIAQESGVSLSTVSMVLSDKPGIPKETRGRVIDVARSLGYQFKNQTISRSTVNLRTVGLILKSQMGEVPQHNEFYSHVIAGIEAACRQHHLNLMFSTISVDADSFPVENPRALWHEATDGLLLVGAFVDEALNHIIGERPCPVVLVDAYSQAPQYDAVLSDNFNGAYRAVEYLIACGHTSIGFVGAHEHAYPSFLERRRGYLQALHDHGIQKPYFADVKQTTVRSDVIAATLNLLNEQPELTALMGVNDNVAIAAMHAALSMGKYIPQDISIIGFDDILLAENVMPPLTTMHVDKISMGRLAINLLLNRAETPQASLVTAVLQPNLVKRMSVRIMPGRE